MKKDRKGFEAGIRKEWERGRGKATMR